MSVELTANTLNQIKELATQAYGHGSDKAGSGRIGMIGGHVVKFNTHYGERHSTTGSMADMRASCDALRTHLYNIARNVYGEEISKGMQKILSKLGLDASGQMPPQKDLLSRSIVAKFVDQLKRDSADLKGAVGDVRGGATVKHTMFADVQVAMKPVLVKDVVDGLRNGVAEGALANAVRGVLVSLDQNQQRLFRDFVAAKVASGSERYGEGLDLNTADGIRALLDRQVSGNSGNVSDCLKYLGKLVEAHDSNAVTRFLEVMRDAPKFSTDMSRMMNSVQSDNPDAFKSQESFARELKSRSGLGVELTAEESADLEGTIARLGPDLARKLEKFSDSAAAVKVEGETSLLDDIRNRASDAVDNAIAKDMLFAGCNSKSVKRDVESAIINRCRVNGRFSVTEDDVKIVLFSEICKQNLKSSRKGTDPEYNLLKDKDMQRSEREICAMDDTQLRAKIVDFSKSLVDKFVTFRTNRDRAYGVARDKLVALGEKLCVKLSADDIDMKSVDKKFHLKDISEVDSNEKVQEVVDKKIGVLTRFAEGLQASTKIPPKVKGAMFKWACAIGPIMPDGMAVMMESLMSAYEELSKTVPGLLSQIDHDNQVIESTTKQKESAPKENASLLEKLDQEIAAAQEDRKARYRDITQAVLSGLCDPIEGNLTEAQRESGVDDLMPIAGVFGHAIADAGDFGPLNQLAQFCKNDRDYGRWLDSEGVGTAIKVPMYVGPLADVEYAPEAGNQA